METKNKWIVVAVAFIIIALGSVTLVIKSDEFSIVLKDGSIKVKYSDGVMKAYDGRYLAFEDYLNIYYWNGKGYTTMYKARGTKYSNLSYYQEGDITFVKQTIRYSRGNLTRFFEITEYNIKESFEWNPTDENLRVYFLWTYGGLDKLDEKVVYVDKNNKETMTVMDFDIMNNWEKEMDNIVRVERFMNGKLKIRTKVFEGKTVFDPDIILAGFPPPINETPINETPEYNETHEYIYEPESKTWIIVPKDDFDGGRDMGDTEEPIERMIIDDITDCSNGVCSATLGKVRFAPYQEEWYEIEKAPSLKESSRIKCVVDYDGKHHAECLDFNNTHRKIKTSIKDNSLKNKDIPIKVLKLNESYFGNDKDKKYYKKSEKKNKYKDLLEEKTEWIKADFGDIIEVGESSTTIKLQEPDSENLDDVWINGDSPDTNYGTYTTLRNAYDTASPYFVETLIKFNISAISNNKNIDNATLYFYFKTNDISRPNYIDVSAMHLYDTFSWVETSVTWNTKPDSIYYGDSLSVKRFIANTPTGTFISWDVTEAVNVQYSNNKDNVSIYLNSSGEGDNFDELQYWSKEYTSDVTKRPYLNITYLEPETDPPTFSAITDNSSVTLYNGTDVQINITIEDATNVDFYTLSHNDTSDHSWTNETIINVESTSIGVIWNYSIENFPTTGGTLGVRFWANDTGGYSDVSDIHTIIVQPIITDTCSCPGLNQNWEVNMEDTCVINDDCNLGTGKLNHTGTYGNFTCNATISTSDRDIAPADTTFYFDNNCLINII